jgi:hypothetical protein
VTPAEAMAAALADAFEGAALADVAKTGQGLSFRAFLESADYCAKTLSPAIAAIADASQGLPIDWAPPALVQALFACPAHLLPSDRRRVVAVSAGGRGGKTSYMLAPRAVHAAWTTPLRAPGVPIDPAFPLAQELARGEHAAAIIVAPRKKLARQAFTFVKGLVEGSPVLRRALMGEPTGESLTLRRPDGLLVDIIIAVADKGGTSVRGKSLVFLGLDEASFFQGDGFAVNDEDIFSAGIQRVVPYGQAWVMSTPWIEGEGLLERLIKEEWGKHRDVLVVARAGTRTLNPSWDPDGTIERTERRRSGGNENADREILAIPLPKGTKAFFSPADVAAALLLHAPDKAPEEKGAGADFGHAAGRDNSGLAIVSRYPGGIFGVDALQEIESTADQRPSQTYRAFALRMLAAGVESCACDVHHKEAVREEWDHHGITFIDSGAKDRMYKGAKTVFSERRLALADLPEHDREALRDQLLTIVAKPLAAGRFQILAPRRKVSDVLAGGTGGGHADTVSGLVAGLWRVGSCDAALWARPESIPETSFDDELLADVPDRSSAGFDRDRLRW